MFGDSAPYPPPSSLVSQSVVAFPESLVVQPDAARPATVTGKRITTLVPPGTSWIDRLGSATGRTRRLGLATVDREADGDGFNVMLGVVYEVGDVFATPAGCTLDPARTEHAGADRT